ncbi:MAG: hypothetical protein ACR2JW_05935 [Thermomicrobiales bacterium]
MQDDQRYTAKAIRRRVILTICVTVVGIILFAIFQTLHSGERVSPWQVLLLLAVTVPISIVTLWLLFRFADRLGLYDTAYYQQVRKRPGETWWRAYRRNLTAAPRRRPLSRIFPLLGVVELLVGAASVRGNALRGMAAILIGVCLLIGGWAENLPDGRRRLLIGLRIVTPTGTLRRGLRYASLP